MGEQNLHDIDFNLVFKENVQIEEVVFEGNTRTKTSFLQDQVADLIGKTVPLAGSFKAVNNRLDGFQIFDGVITSIAPAAPGQDVSLDKPYPCKITVQLKERFKWKGWLGLKGSQEDTSVPVLSVNATVPNAFGRADEFHTDFGAQLPSLATHGTVGMRFPTYKNGIQTGERNALAFSTKADHQSSSGYTSHLVGVDTTTMSISQIFSSSSSSPDEEEGEVGKVGGDGPADPVLLLMGSAPPKPTGRISHLFGSSFHCRRVFPSASASLRIREWAGNSVKNSLLYKGSYDSRDNALCPRSGRFLQLSGEVAGLGGDVSFLKGNLNIQSFHSLPFGLTLGLVGRAGGIYSLKDHLPEIMGSYKEPGPLDRFYMGGSSSLRGFQDRGAGPRENEHALGGNIFGEIFASLTSPLPSPFPDFVHFHSFLEAGTIGDVPEHLSNNVRAVAGGGLVVTGLGCRIELNLIRKLIVHSSDQFLGYQLRFTPDMV